MFAPMTWKRSLVLRAAVVACVIAGPLASQEPAWPTTVTRGELYDHYLTGNEADVKPATTGGVLLAGGGTDQPDAFKWLFAHAGGGDIVVLRASGADGYHPFAMKIGGLDSIESFVVKSREASSDPKLLERLGRAEAIFFAGGDQSKYVTFFKDSPVETMVNAAAARGVPVGGTSAGLAILSEFSYSAMRASITTAQALADPLSPDITLDKDFLSLKYLDGLITDSHVVERSRLGRTVAFMARLHQDGWLKANGATPARPARALAIDRETAVLLERDGTATVVGPNTAYFMEAAQPPQQYRAGTPLTYHPIQVYKVTRASTFNFTTWSGTGGQSLTFEIRDGVFQER
ncbi:MAG: cyanophycinase [Acidobacteria bacterium]|jgi:cyanophycinase-like exopeptidase|nr:cyanophycinase [Acidobacteriota bacterium]